MTDENSFIDFVEFSNLYIDYYFKPALFLPLYDALSKIKANNKKVKKFEVFFYLLQTEVMPLSFASINNEEYTYLKISLYNRTISEFGSSTATDNLINKRTFEYMKILHGKNLKNLPTEENVGDFVYCALKHCIGKFSKNYLSINSVYNILVDSLIHNISASSTLCSSLEIYREYGAKGLLTAFDLAHDKNPFSL